RMRDPLAAPGAEFSILDSSFLMARARDRAPYALPSSTTSPSVTSPFHWLPPPPHVPPGAPASGPAPGAPRPPPRCFLSAPRLARLVRRLGERGEPGLNRRGVRAGVGLPDRFHRRLDRRFVRRAELVARVLQEPFGAVHGLIGAIAQFDFLTPLLVLFRVRLG